MFRLLLYLLGLVHGHASYRSQVSLAPFLPFSIAYMIERTYYKPRGVTTMITAQSWISRIYWTLTAFSPNPGANMLLGLSAFNSSPFVKWVPCPREYLSSKEGLLVLWAHLDIQNLILLSSLYTEQCAKCQGSNIHFYPDYNPFFLKTEAYAYAYAWSTWKFGTEALRPWTGLCSYLFCLTHYWILRSD